MAGSPRFGEVLRTDLLARYPDAARWGPLRVAAAFLVDPSLRAVLTIRLALRSGDRMLFICRAWTVARLRSEVFRCEIGPGLQLPHPFGVVIAPGTFLGRNVTLHHSVTLGYARAPRPQERLPTPSVEDGVEIHPGSVVVGDITIGPGACIGPGSVVSRDVAPGAVVTAAG